MAIVPDPRWRVLDASGNAIVGATLLVRTAGTTVPASIYRDANLTVPMTNPLSGSDASDAQGYFPQFFALEGATFDIVLKNSGGATLTDGSLVSVPAVGQASGVFIRDLTGSRFKVSNAAGVVQIETGDPTGDDTGGKVRIGGWAGTQGDSASIDYAATDFTGNVTVNGGKKLPGAVQTEATFSAVSSLDIALPASPSGVYSWEIEIIDLVMSAVADLSLRFSTDGGASYRSTSDYGTQNLVVSGSTATATATAGVTSAKLGGSVSAPNKSRLRLVVYCPSGATGGMSAAGEIWAYGATFAATIFSFNVVYAVGSVGPATHVRIFPASGTLTGRYRVIPRRGFGE